MLPAKVTTILAVSLLGIGLSNLMYDRGIRQYLSRKVGHVFGGCAYFLAVLWLDAVQAVSLAVIVALLIALVRFILPVALRGVGGTGRITAYAEVSYAVAGAVSLAVGWLWLGDRWLGLLPVSFLAFGDSATGIVRSLIYHREVKGLAGSVAMLGVCLGLAALYPVYWVGAVGAVAATIAERFSPIAVGIWDDNWILVGASLLTMAFLSRF